MLNIFKNSLDGIILGSKRNVISIDVLNNPKYFLEFDRSNKTQSDDKLVTISVLSQIEFNLDGKVINTDNINNFIEKENPYIEIADDGITYIFPNYNLVLYINSSKTEFMQILIYDKSIKHIYEDENLLRYFDDKYNKTIYLPTSNLTLIPYKSIGQFNFGLNILDFTKEFDIKLNDNSNSEDKKIIEINNFIFRFDNKKLTQVTIYNYKKNINSIYYNDIDISTKKGLSDLIKSNNVIERTISKYLFPELGLVIEKDLSEFRFFAEPLLKFWSNIHRPITSW